VFKYQTGLIFVDTLLATKLRYTNGDNHVIPKDVLSNYIVGLIFCSVGISSIKINI